MLHIEGVCVNMCLKELICVSKVFARNLQNYRTQARMTQGDLAKSVDLTRNAIANYEAGRSEPNFEILCKFSEILGVEIEDLVSDRPAQEDYIRRVMVTDEESALLQVFREADPIYQGVALDILRQHKRKAE
jgi:transcriptional regulator with XRE-family HTH domain